VVNALISSVGATELAEMTNDTILYITLRARLRRFPAYPISMSAEYVHKSKGAESSFGLQTITELGRLAAERGIAEVVHLDPECVVLRAGAMHYALSPFEARLMLRTMVRGMERAFPMHLAAVHVEERTAA
jgi:hypothetical protein